MQAITKEAILNYAKQEQGSLAASAFISFLFATAMCVFKFASVPAAFLIFLVWTALPHVITYVLEKTDCRDGDDILFFVCVTGGLAGVILGGIIAAPLMGVLVMGVLTIIYVAFVSSVCA